MPDEGRDLIALTAEIVAAQVANNHVATSEVGPLITNVYAALSQLGAPDKKPTSETRPEPATTARRSLSRSSHIISMIDGKSYKMLRRHIGQHGYTPESYREAFGLPKDYPMVAHDYAEQRRALAQSIGLGRRPNSVASAAATSEEAGTEPTAEAAEPPAAKRPRRKLKPVFGEAVAAAKEHLGGE